MRGIIVAALTTFACAPSPEAFCKHVGLLTDQGVAKEAADDPLLLVPDAKARDDDVARCVRKATAAKSVRPELYGPCGKCVIRAGTKDELEACGPICKGL